jgi:hypothetical protein
MIDTPHHPHPKELDELARLLAPWMGGEARAALRGIWASRSWRPRLQAAETEMAMATATVATVTVMATASPWPVPEAVTATGTTATMTTSPDGRLDEFPWDEHNRLKREAAEAQKRARAAEREAKKQRDKERRESGQYDEILAEKEEEVSAAATRAEAAEYQLEQFQRRIRVQGVAQRLGFRDTEDAVRFLDEDDRQLHPAVWSAASSWRCRRRWSTPSPTSSTGTTRARSRGVGNTVLINSIGDPTIFDYTKNTDMPSPETLTGSQKSADHHPGQGVQLPGRRRRQGPAAAAGDGHRAGAGGLPPGGRDRPVPRFADGRRLAPSTPSARRPAHRGPHADAGRSTGAYEQLVDLGTKLDENNVPTDGRWVVVPPWYHGVLVKDSTASSRTPRSTCCTTGRSARPRASRCSSPTTCPPWRRPSARPTRSPVTRSSRAPDGTTYAEQINSGGGVPPGEALRRRGQGSAPLRCGRGTARGPGPADHDPARAPGRRTRPRPSSSSVLRSPASRSTTR